MSPRRHQSGFNSRLARLVSPGCIWPREILLCRPDKIPPHSSLARSCLRRIRPRMIAVHAGREGYLFSKGDIKIMWEKPSYEIVETCCEIGAYVYTEEVKNKLSDEPDEKVEAYD